MTADLFRLVVHYWATWLNSGTIAANTTYVFLVMLVVAWLVSLVPEPRRRR